MLIEGVGIGADAAEVFDAVRVLEDGRLFCEQGTHRFLGFRVAIRPEGLHRIESGANSFCVGVAVLHDDAFNRVLMPESNAIADGRTVVLHIDAELLEAEDTKEQFLNIIRQAIEGVFKFVHVRCIAIAEADVIRSDDMEFVLRALG